MQATCSEACNQASAPSAKIGDTPSVDASILACSESGAGANDSAMSMAILSSSTSPGGNADVMSWDSAHVSASLADSASPNGSYQGFGHLRTAPLVHLVLAMLLIAILGAPRDFCAVAEESYSGPVPEDLITYLDKHRDCLLEETRDAWRSSDNASAGSWSDVFGGDAEEIFMAWHLASHIESLAEAGRAVHDLPTYVNAWLVQPGMANAGQYPSGGPVSRMLDVWRAAAPHIDFTAPDIYLQTFKDVCRSYARSGNPLFIPEARMDARAASTAFYAFGSHAAIGFGPFAVDDLPADHPMGDTYGLLREMVPMLAEYQANGRIVGFYQEDEKDMETVLLGDYTVHMCSNQDLPNVDVPGGGILFMLSHDEFLAVGRNYQIMFSTPDAEGANVELLSVDEGTIKNGEWVHHRRLNGDETLHGRAIPLWSHLTVCKAKLNVSVVPVCHQPDWEFPE